MNRRATTGIYILPWDGHTHTVTDPGHHHQDHEREKTRLEIGPAIDVHTGERLINKHTHDVIDLAHRHLDGDIAVTGIFLGISDDHTHKVVEYGHHHV